MQHKLVLKEKDSIIIILSLNNNLLLTKHEGRTEEYWPEVMTVPTEHSEARTKTI